MFSLGVYYGVICLYFIYTAEGDGLGSLDSHPSWAFLPRDNCGITRFDQAADRIIKGEEALLGQFPWIVRIGITLRRTIRPFFNCAGSLLNQHYVLSAAHCGKDNDVVRVGENVASTEIDCEDDVCAPIYQDVAIKRFIFLGYDKLTHKRDISLILLTTPVTYNDFVVPICLPYGPLLQKDFRKKDVKVAGWGYINSTTMQIPNQLMYITAPILDHAECNKLFKNKLDETQLCVGYKEGKDSCSGDSGGPMTRSERVLGKRQHYLIGLVSYGLTKCGAGPAVYTNIAYYLDWILDNIEQ